MLRLTNYGTGPGSSAATLSNPGVDQPGETGHPPAPGRSVLLKILLVFVLACAFFGLWVPQAYSGDDLQYAGVIKQATSSTFLFHPAGGRDYDPATNAAHFNPGETISIINPRYLLEWPTSVATVNLWKLFGWQGDVL